MQIKPSSTLKQSLRRERSANYTLPQTQAHFHCSVEEGGCDCHSTSPFRRAWFTFNTLPWIKGLDVKIGTQPHTLSHYSGEETSSLYSTIEGGKISRFQTLTLLKLWSVWFKSVCSWSSLLIVRAALWGSRDTPAYQTPTINRILYKNKKTVQYCK